MDRRLLAFVLPVSLAGCGMAPDDPTNVPLAGKWQRSMRLIAFTINDVAIDRAHPSINLPKDSSETQCGEPRFRTREEAQREIDAAGSVKCTIDTIDLDRTTVSGAGVCAPKDYGSSKIAGKFSYDIEQTPQAIDGKIVVDAYAHLPSGQTEQAYIAYKLEWRRLGDCR